MTLLTELSTELLLHIASFLPQIDLLNISLTNSILRDATEAELYREFIKDAPRVDGERKVLLFVQRIIDQPKLARYVHYLDTDLWSTLAHWHPDFDRAYVDCGLSPKDYEYFANAALSANIITSIREYGHKSNLASRLVAMRHLVDEEGDVPGWSDFIYDPNTYIDQVPFDDRFCQSLQAGIEEPLFLLVLTLLNNLREIRLRGAPNKGQRHHLLPLLNPDHRFSALKRLTVKASDSQFEWPLTAFVHQIQSPNLEALECYATTEWERDGYGKPWKHDPLILTVPPRSLSIIKVMLQYSALSAAGIKNLLGACRSLKSFYFSAGGSQVGPSNFNLFELMAALAPHKNSLETLQLDMETDLDGPQNEPGWISDLSDFTALETLVLTCELENRGAFTDEEDPTPLKSRLCNILPTSLRSLTFQKSGRWPIDTAEQIEEMIALRPHKFENLENITVTMHENHTEPWIESARKGQDKTVRMCKEAGVELVVTSVVDNIEITFFEIEMRAQIYHESGEANSNPSEDMEIDDDNDDESSDVDDDDEIPGLA